MSIKKRVLVTGSNGLLGKAFIELRNDKFNITALTRSVIEAVNPNVKYLQLDLASNWSADHLPTEIDTIIHLAQSEKFKNFPEDSQDVFNVNLGSTVKLLDYAYKTGVSKFILASTGGIYRREASPLDTNSEIEAPDQLSQYFGTKLASEIFASNYKNYFSVDILRLFFMYGPGQREHMFIPRMMRNIADGKAISISGGFGIQLNPIFVTDVARLVEHRVFSEKSEVINVCGSETVSIKELAQKIGEILNVNPKFNYVGSAADLIADPSRTSEILSGDFTTLQDGLTFLAKSMRLI